MSDAMRSGAIFSASSDALRSPVPRLRKPTAQHAAPAALPSGSGSGARGGSFEALYRGSPMPKVVALHGRRERPGVMAAPAARTATATASSSGGGGGGSAAAAAGASPSGSADAQKVLTEWQLVRCELPGGAVGLKVMGKRTAGAGAAAEPFLSSHVASRAASHKVVTTDGSMLLLRGPLAASTRAATFSAATLAAFADGFPVRWEDVVGDDDGPAAKKPAAAAPVSAERRTPVAASAGRKGGVARFASSSRSVKKRARGVHEDASPAGEGAAVVESPFDFPASSPPRGSARRGSKHKAVSQSASSGGLLDDSDEGGSGGSIVEDSDDEREEVKPSLSAQRRRKVAQKRER